MEWFAILIASIFILGYYQQDTYLMSVSDKKSVTLSAVISIYALGKQEEIKTVLVHTKLIYSLGTAWIG